MRSLLKLTNSDQPLGGRYKIIGEIGEGGFGQTFLAEDLHLPDHPQCVVKQLKPQVSDAESLQIARRLFDMEARVLYQLGDHNQIPRLLAHFEDNQEFYLAQELIEGEALTNELVEGRPWPEIEVISLLNDLLHVLTFVHQQNVIHRDIKPSNLIRRSQDNKIVLIDFGAVKQVSTQVINAKTGQTRTISIGTQGYTPKEQLGGHPRFSSDVYAVGIVGIQALTGVHPRHFREDPQTGEIEWHSDALQVSPELAAILDCMVRYDFRVRYPTALEALEAVQSLSTAPTEVLPQSSQQSQPPATTTPGVGTDHLSTHIWVPIEPPAQSLPTPELTGSGTDHLSTHLWVPTEPPEQSQSRVSNTHSNAPQATPEQSLHSSKSSAPAIANPSLVQRRFVKPWLVIAVSTILAAGSATLLLTKTVLSPERTSQSINRSEVPTATPTTSIGEIASPTPSNPATANPTTSPVEKTPSSSSSSATTPISTTNLPQKSTIPSPRSPVTINPTTNPSQKSTQALPTSPPVVAKVSPTPTQPTQKTPPPRKEPLVTERLSEADRLRIGGQYQKAIAAYDQVIASKPDVAQAYWGRCYSLNSLQQSEAAIGACNKALELKPDYPEALWSKGNALDQQQRPMDALKLYEQATALKPDFAEAWNNQGVALLALGRSKEAVAAFDKATTLKPDFANAWANRGAALWRVGRIKQAIASIDRALQIQPDNQDSINLRRQVQEKLGR